MGSLVSLVMTDIVGSTQRWSTHDSTMATDLEQHDTILRGIVNQCGGRVFKHTGDGMIAVFDDPVAAVTSAAAIQQRMGEATWQQPERLQVRAAAHSGVVYERDGDMFGTAVNKLARILSVCPPGAVLVSNVIADLLAERAPEGLGIRSIGEAELNGFTAPEVLHAVTGPGVAEVNVPAAAREDRQGGPLPPVDEELIGRGDELASIWEALGRTRLVTLVGVGGMGKTRLALEVAAGGVDAFAGGVWWVDLSTATGPEAVVPVAMASVGARETPGRTALESFCDRFTGRSALIVVDNCEHVLAAAGELIRALRTAAPEVRIVATSREALGTRGEQLVPVGSLPGVDGIALFAERALAVRPDLDVHADRAVIERICSRLDGIPLAIELAAARCRSMAPAEIDELLGDRFRLLRGGRSGAERHRTLQAAVAWSYGMLDRAERTVFDQMAVFGGGTLTDGLVAVTGMDRIELLDAVDQLVARSMVVASRTPLGTRYHQLETLRQYAEDRLVEAGTMDAIRDRHLRWVVSLALGWSGARGLEAEAAAISRFASEIDNLRLAVAHARNSGRTDTACMVVALTSVVWFSRPVIGVADWVRPFPVGHEWTPWSATCAAIGSLADVNRGLSQWRSTSPDDVPGWYRLAPPAAKCAAVTAHLGSGGDWRVALDLLDDVEPGSDDDLAQIEWTRLFAQYFRQLEAPIDDAGIGLVVEHAAHAAAVAQRTGSALIQAWMETFLAWALGWRRPELAATHARNGYELARRLGAEAVADSADGAVGLAVSDSPTVETMAILRGRVTEVLRSGRAAIAMAMLWPIVPALAARDPRSVLRLWAVSRRNGYDARGHFRDAGLAVPEGAAELAALEREVAGSSLADAIRDALAVLDGVIASAIADAGAETAPGGGS